MASPTVPVAAPRAGRVRADRRRPSAVGRRRRAPLVVAVVAALFFVAVAAAAIQIRLISGQRELDRLERRIEEAQVRQDDLRQQEALLRSPEQISQIAANDLGMVHAAPPVMVTPAPRVLGTLEPQTTTTVAATAEATR